MKNILAYIGVLSAVLFISSYRTTDNKSSLDYQEVLIPLKQSQVITVRTTQEVNRLIKKGYVLEHVNVVQFGYPSEHITQKYYTLVKY